MSGHVLTPGEGFTAGFVICETCHRVMLPEDAEAHSARPVAPLSVFRPDPVEPDRRESQIVWEKPGGDAA